MRNRFLRSVIVAFSLVLGLGVMTSAPAQAAVAPHKPVPLVRDCPGNKSTVKPRALQLACADGNERLATLKWKLWSTSKAVGGGTLYVNDCAPDCASGHFHSYKASVVLTKVKRTKVGTMYFTRYTLSWVQSGKRHTEAAMPISF
jgi:hypothetical protein